MSGRQHVDRIMNLYDELLKDLWSKVKEMNIKPAEKPLVYTLVMAEISRKSYEESQKHQG